MSTFTVHLPLDTYVTNTGEVRDIGDIYIQLDQYYFPSKAWYDFGQNLLSWWTEEFIKLITGEETKVECGFMDGAFRFDVKVLDSEIWLVHCIREYADDEELEFEAEVNSVQASESLLQQVQAMIDFLKERKKDKAADWLNERKESLILAMQPKLESLDKSLG